MNPFQTIKTRIKADTELKNEQQRQRIERLAQLEAEQNRKGFHIPNPVQSMRTKKEIKQLKREIAAFEENKRKTKIVIYLVPVWIILMCVLIVMGILNDKAPSKDAIPPAPTFMQGITEFIPTISVDITDASVDVTQLAEDAESVIDGTEVLSEDAFSDAVAETEIEPIQLSPQKFRITWSAKLVDSNHVGSTWSTTFEVDNEELPSGSVITVAPNSQFTICLTIQDNDSNPESDSYFAKIAYSEELCKNGYEITQKLYVTENAGRYSGYSAEWDFTISITPVK